VTGLLDSNPTSPSSRLCPCPCFRGPAFDQCPVLPQLSCCRVARETQPQGQIGVSSEWSNRKDGAGANWLTRKPLRGSCRWRSSATRTTRMPAMPGDGVNFGRMVKLSGTGFYPKRFTVRTMFTCRLKGASAARCPP
jgi:hypothetical protein